MGVDLLADPRLTAVGLLVEVYGELTARLSAVHASHGLAGNEFDALIRLARSPGCRLRLSDLAAQTGLSTSGITRIVDRLERRGLLERASRPGDRRICLAVLTRHGQDTVLADIPELLDAVDASLIGPLTRRQLDALLDALRALRDTLRPRAVAGARPPAVFVAPRLANELRASGAQSGDGGVDVVDGECDTADA